jgi:hypothetical protein
MSEKKMVSRNVAVALGIICIILIVGLGLIMAYYTMTINNKDTTYNEYVSTHSHTNAEYDSMWTPYLIEVDLGATENGNPAYVARWLHVTGFVVNVHKNWAYNCTLHVVAYQSGGVTATDTYINLGTIAGESYSKVDANVYYYTDITNYTITPQWTASP